MTRTLYSWNLASTIFLQFLTARDFYTFRCYNRWQCFQYDDKCFPKGKFENFVWSLEWRSPPHSWEGVNRCILNLFFFLWIIKPNLDLPTFTISPLIWYLFKNSSDLMFTYSQKRDQKPQNKEKWEKECIFLHSIFSPSNHFQIAIYTSFHV